MQKKRQWIDLGIIILAVIMPKLILVFFSLPLRTLSDEMGTLAVASNLAGFDWSGVIPLSGYYGYGYTALFYWLFLIFDDPIIVYRSFLIINVFLQSIGAFISYKILSETKIIDNRRNILLLSIIAGYLVVTRANIIYNEQALIFMSWCITYVIYKLITNIDNKKKKSIYTTILMLLLIWALTIHVRSIIYFIALIIVTLIYYIRTKKWIIDLKLIVLFVLGYIGVKYLSTSLQNSIWTSAEGLRNTEISISTSIIEYFKTDTLNWTAWLNIIIGQIYTITIVSGGITIPIIIIFITLFIRWVSNKEINNKFILYYIIGLFFSICIVGTILGQSLTWLPEASKAVSAGFLDNQTYGTKAFTYIRYFGPYIGPVLWSGLVLCICSEVVKKHIKDNIYVFIGLTVYWIFVIYPFIDKTTQTGTLEALYPFSGGTVLSDERIRYTLPSVIICIFSFIFTIKMILNKKSIILMAFLSTLLMYQYIYNAITYDIYYQKLFSDKIIETYNFIEENENEFTKLAIKDFNVYDARDIGHGLYFNYQFWLPRYHIISGIPEIFDEKTVLISNVSLEEQIPKDSIYEIKLKDNQYIYMGENIKEEFIK